MGKILNCLMMILAFSHAACRSDKKFAPNVDAGAVASSKVEGSDASIATGANAGGTDASKSGPLPVCDKNAVGITQARLLSNGISTQLGTQNLRYELSVLNCKDGSVESLKDQPIFFDLNGTITQGFQPIAYAILDANGAPISAAPLQVVTGSDLFGNTGNFAHWTTANFSYSSKIEKLILEIKLENMQVLPREAADIKIDSYLRIGKAQAVTQSLTILP